ncbi:MAG: SDR family oxidoreductase [Pseudomonadota bacterium]
MSRFRDKVILITGAASGFGQLLTERLAAGGAQLVVGDIDEGGVNAVAGQAGDNVVAMACDVTVEDQVEALVERAVDVYGRLDIAINNAGIVGKLGNLVDTTEADMNLSFAVNAKGVFFGMKHQIPVLITGGGGSILNVSSMAGINGAPKATAYAAAKHAVIGMTKTAAVEYGRKNVRVNAVCPFFTLTPMVTENIDPDTQALVSGGSPMKRLGEPGEVVSTMLNVIDPANTYLNGQAIAIDGGVSAI